MTPDPNDTATPVGPPLEPIASLERYDSIDVLRGVAVLGILAMNIYFFGMPAAAYSNPSLYGGASGVNLITWLITHLFFEMKFMTIFSALFGAGLVVMFQRAEARRRPLAGIYYRRILWLLVFALVHAYALWRGDILFTYGIAGLLIFLFRRRSPRALIIVGCLILLIPSLTAYGFGVYVDKTRAAARDVTTLAAAGESPTEKQEKLAESWDQMRPYFDPTPGEIDEEIEIYRDGYAGVFRHRAPISFMAQTMALGFFALWRAGGVMLLGMALMKLGVFSAARSRRFYRNCVVWGYGIGLPLAAVSAWDLIRVNWSMPHAVQVSSHFNYYGSLGVALGHMGAVMLICQTGSLPRLRRRLSAVGRMAFSNYIFQTIVCTTIFYGYGLGLFGRFNRFPLMFFVVAVWLLQLWISPWWLGRFRYGPLEWLWRSLSYGHRQPMRRLRQAVAIGLAAFTLAAWAAESPAQDQKSGEHHHDDDATIERRFEDAEMWASRFENPGRDAWQLPDSIIATLVTRPDMVVADIGSATGYFPVRFARACPDGFVIGADIEPDMIHYLNDRARREGLPNLVSVLAAPDDPHLPMVVDLVFICNTYHHINDRVDYFTRLKQQLRPNGCVAVVDYRPASKRGPPHKLAPDVVESEMIRAGFDVAERHEFLPEQYFLVFRVGTRE